jgi:hypothetical protein
LIVQTKINEAVEGYIELDKESVQPGVGADFPTTWISPPSGEEEGCRAMRVWNMISVLALSRTHDIWLDFAWYALAMTRRGISRREL